MSEPIELTIRLDIDKVIAPTYAGYDEDDEPYGAEPRTLEDVVLDLTTAQIVAGLDKDIRRDLASRVKAIRDEMIRTAVAPVIEEALAGPITKTNSYGEPIGTPTTLREIITADARSALKLVPRSQRGSRNSYDMTPATKVMYEEVDRAVAAEVKTIVQQVKDETTDAIRSAAADAIAKAVPV